MLKDVYSKLKVKEGMNLLILNAPVAYLTSTDEIPLSISIHTEANNKQYRFVQLFAKNQQELTSWGDRAIQSLEDDGVLWICYPKKTSPLYENLSRDEGWDAVTSLGMEGVSLISVDDTWSAMRFRPKNAASKERKRQAPESSKEGFESKELVMPEELKVIFKDEPEAAIFFDQLAASYKRSYLEWITSAKREETKHKRILEMVEKLKMGYKNPYAK